MIRVLDLERALHFFCDGLGMQQVRRRDVEQGRFTLVFLSTGEDGDDAMLELTWNWDQEEPYTGGRNFGHVAFAVDDIYATCEHLQSMGEILRPPEMDGWLLCVRPMKFPLSLQRGEALPLREPWQSMASTGTW